MTTDLGTAKSGQRFALGAYGDLLIVVRFDSPTLADFGELEQATAEIAAESRDGGFGLLVIIVQGNDKPPGNDVRKRNAELVARYSSQIWGMARVIEGTGIKASMVRFALSTIDLLATTPVTEKTLDSVDSAVLWLKTLRPSLHERAVLKEVERLKAWSPRSASQPPKASRSTATSRVERDAARRRSAR